MIRYAPTSDTASSPVWRRIRLSRDEAARGRDRLAQKIAFPEADAARGAAESWAPGGPDPEEGAAAPRQMTSRPPGGERLSSQASVTAGIVSRLAGPHDDPHQLQVTAPVQPGNSGSPLLDASGAVVGVVVAKLNALRFVRRTEAIPENVNFAVNGQYARALLDRRGVPYQTATADETLSTPAIAERALKFTVLVQCFR